MHLGHYLGLLRSSETNLASAFRDIASAHAAEPDVVHECRLMAADCDRHADRLAPFTERYGQDAPTEPERLRSNLFQGTRSGGLGLLRDLHDLYLMASECEISWTIIGQAAQGTRDLELLGLVHELEHETSTQRRWLRTRMKTAAPQALVVAR